MNLDHRWGLEVPLDRWFMSINDHLGERLVDALQYVNTVVERAGLLETIVSMLVEYGIRLDQAILTNGQAPEGIHEILEEVTSARTEIEPSTEAEVFRLVGELKRKLALLAASPEHR